MLCPPRVVGNLVGGIACRVGQFLCDLVEVCGVFIVDGRPVLALHGLEEGGAGFDREFVERKVIGAEGEGAGELYAPVFGGLVRQRVDQVDRGGAEMALRLLKRRARIGGAMRAAEEFEARLIERLQAERQAVDAG